MCTSVACIEGAVRRPTAVRRGSTTEVSRSQPHARGSSRACGRGQTRAILLLVIGAALMALGSASGCTKSGKLEPGAFGADKALALACVAPASNEPRDVICSRWACGHADLAAAPWNGNPKSCVAGTIDTHAYERALGMINTYRFLAGLPELTAEARWDGPAQDCALLAHANTRLAHAPTPDWSCWSDRGARASAVSLVANRSAPQAIDPFIEDKDNETTLVHRRWLLSEKIHRIGLGSTSRFACVLVDGREWDGEPVAASGAVALVDGGATIEAHSAVTLPVWVAWPPPGPVPMDALRRTSVDRTGWTVQSSSLDLDDASIEVRVDGEPRPISVTPLERTMGSLTAVRFLPQGWSTEPGRRYDVHVTKERSADADAIDIAFGVEPTECP